MKASSHGMRRSRRPWHEKLRPDQQPKICEDPRGRGKMLVPTPMLVAAEVSRVRPGRLLKVSELRDRLANQAGAALTCPFTPGTFMYIMSLPPDGGIAT